jgi:hypothetical protein
MKFIDEKWAGHVIRIEEMLNAHIINVLKSEGRRSLGETFA